MNTILMDSNKLTSYWISFPKNINFPVGFGVTASSIEDAYYLLEELDFTYHKIATEVDIQENVLPTDVPYGFVADSAGPVVVRGVWYPCNNIGY